MRRARLSLALFTLLLAGCTSAPSASQPRPIVYADCRSMPLAVGDGVGAAIFTTRASLASRGIQTETRTASAPDSQR